MDQQGSSYERLTVDESLDAHLLKELLRRIAGPMTVRFRRWAEQGVWDAMLDTLVELGLTDDWQHMIDSTIVRGHSQAAGAKGGPARKALVEAAAALRAKSTPVVTVKDALLASS